MIKFEIGEKYYGKHTNGKSIEISKRTDKTIWFCQNMFSSKILVMDNVETITPKLGLCFHTYRADMVIK